MQLACKTIAVNRPRIYLYLKYNAGDNFIREINTKFKRTKESVRAMELCHVFQNSFEIRLHVAGGNSEQRMQVVVSQDIPLF